MVVACILRVGLRQSTHLQVRVEHVQVVVIAVATGLLQRSVAVGSESLCLHRNQLRVVNRPASRGHHTCSSAITALSKSLCKLVPSTARNTLHVWRRGMRCKH